MVKHRRRWARERLQYGLLKGKMEVKGVFQEAGETKLSEGEFIGQKWAPKRAHFPGSFLSKNSSSHCACWNCWLKMSPENRHVFVPVLRNAKWKSVRLSRRMRSAHRFEGAMRRKFSGILEYVLNRATAYRKRRACGRR